MTTTTRRGVIAGAAAALVAGPALAQTPGPKVVEAAKVFPYLENFLKLPAADRSRFTVAYFLMQNGKPVTGVRAWLLNGDQRIPLPIAADGRVGRLPTLAELRAKAKVELSASPETRFSVNMAVLPLMRAAAELDAAELARAVEQANASTKKAAGVLGLAVPKFDRAVFKGVTSGSIIHTDGRTTAMAVVKGSPVFDPDKARTAKTLKFARAPSQIMIGPSKG